MLIARAGGTLLIGLDATNLALLPNDQPIVISNKHPAMREPVTEVVIDAAPTLTELVDKWKKAGLLPPDFAFSEPKPTKPRH